jgi:hypothetical protein
MYRGIRIPTIEIGRRYRKRLHLLRAADETVGASSATTWIGVAAGRRS